MTTLPGQRALRAPVTTPAPTRSATPSESSSVWTPRSRWPRKATISALGTDPMPTWMVARSGTRSATSWAIRWSMSDGVAGGTSTNGRATSVQSDDLADVDLVAAEGPGHPIVDLEEERHLADERSRVVAAGAEREVAVLVHRRRGGEHQRAPGRLPQQARQLREVVRDEIAGPLVERRTGDRRQEVGDVAEPAGERAVEVRPVVQGVHLMDAHAVEPVGGRPRARR